MNTELVEKIRNKTTFNYNSFNDKWIELCSDRHKNIRERIGGEYIEFDFKIENKTLKADQEKIYSIVDELFGMSEKACEGGSKNAEKNICFQLGSSAIGGEWKKSILCPTVPRGSHGVLKTSKILTYAFERIFNTTDQKKILSKKISELGEIWARGNTKKQNICAVLDTRPEAFINLGYYEVDQDSCFKAGGGGEIGKITLAEYPDSFITVFKEKDKIIGRMWGFLDGEVMNFCNYYFAPKVHEGNILECIKFISSSVLNVPFDDLKLKEDNIVNESDIYLNGYFKVSIGKEIKGNIKVKRKKIELGSKA